MRGRVKSLTRNFYTDRFQCRWNIFFYHECAIVRLSMRIISHSCTCMKKKKKISCICIGINPCGSFACNCMTARHERQQRRQRQRGGPSALLRPATNRNVYFTRRKLVSLAKKKRERQRPVTVALRCAALRCTELRGAFLLRLTYCPFIPFAFALLSSCGGDAGYKFRGGRRFNAPRERHMCETAG